MLNILIADDDAAALRSLEYDIKKHVKGHLDVRINTVNLLHEVPVTIQRFMPHLIMMDIQWGKASGSRTAGINFIMNLPVHLRHIPVLFVSGLADADFLVQAAGMFYTVVEKSQMDSFPFEKYLKALHATVEFKEKTSEEKNSVEAYNRIIENPDNAKRVVELYKNYAGDNSKFKRWILIDHILCIKGENKTTKIYFTNSELVYTYSKHTKAFLEKIRHPDLIPEVFNKYGNKNNLYINKRFIIQDVGSSIYVNHPKLGQLNFQKGYD